MPIKQFGLIVSFLRFLDVNAFAIEFILIKARSLRSRSTRWESYLFMFCGLRLLASHHFHIGVQNRWWYKNPYWHLIFIGNLKQSNTEKKWGICADMKTNRQAVVFYVSVASESLLPIWIPLSPCVVNSVQWATLNL